MMMLMLVVLLMGHSVHIVCTHEEEAPPKTCFQKGLTRCPMNQPFFNVSIYTDNTFRYIESTMCPPYINPGWTNHAQACIFKKLYRVPLTAKAAKVPIPVGETLTVFEGIRYLKEDPKPILGALGVLTNGVNIFGVGSPCGYSSKCPNEGAPSKWVDAVESEGHTVDTCGGHAAPSLEYHIHSGVGMNKSSDREGCKLAKDITGQHSAMLGWLFDGYELYGRYSEGGKVPTNLDDCGGHTHSIDGVQMYHYHIPDTFPWTIGCYKGCPEISNNPVELSFVKNSIYGC